MIFSKSSYFEALKFGVSILRISRVTVNWNLNSVYFVYKIMRTVISIVSMNSTIFWLQSENKIAL